MRELSIRAVGIGIAIGICLGAANAYVGLKVGMSVNASIPAAVVAMLVLRGWLRNGTILECNLAQTIGSCGQSVAAGMIFTIPALFMLGQDPKLVEMVIWGGMGGLLGICFMVPLRRLLIVREHDVLPYPEGLACSKVLQSGERGGIGAGAVIRGAVVGGGFRLLAGLGFWPETATSPVAPLVRAQASLSAEPALLGVGYIIGPRIAAVMFAGAATASFVLIPGIAFFGQGTAVGDGAWAGRLIGSLSPGEIHSQYIRYIGAGAVTAAGLISLVKSFPTILASFWDVVKGVLRRNGDARPRTDRDLPSGLLLFILAGLALAMWVFPQVRVGHLGAVAIVVFSFFFVTVTSRIVGLVGASSTPASGMTIAALLATALAFRHLAGDGGEDPLLMKVACLSVGAIVCCAICISGDIAQDLKTGFLVQATPWKQQVGEMIGVTTAVVANAAVILLLAQTQGFVETEAHPNPLPAPQANIMRILVDGVFGGQLPWELLIIGAALAVVVELLAVPALPYAVGFYLPISLPAPIMVGGLVRLIVERRRDRLSESDPGILTSSGLVAGNGLVGIGLVAVTAGIGWWAGDPRWLNPLSGRAEPLAPHHFVPWLWEALEMPLRWGFSPAAWSGWSLVPFALLTIWLWRQTRDRTTV